MNKLATWRRQEGALCQVSNGLVGHYNIALVKLVYFRNRNRGSLQNREA